METITFVTTSFKMQVIDRLYSIDFKYDPQQPMIIPRLLIQFADFPDRL